MKLGFYECMDDEYKSKIVLEVLESRYGKVVVYKFWNQVGNKTYVTTYEHFTKEHKFEKELT